MRKSKTVKEVTVLGAEKYWVKDKKLSLETIREVERKLDKEVVFTN